MFRIKSWPCSSVSFQITTYLRASSAALLRKSRRRDSTSKHLGGYELDHSWNSFGRPKNVKERERILEWLMGSLQKQTNNNETDKSFSPARSNFTFSANGLFLIQNEVYIQKKNLIQNKPKKQPNNNKNNNNNSKA